MYFDDGASRATAELRFVLAYWVGYLGDEAVEAWPADTLPGMAGWLLKRLDRIRQLDDPCQAYGDITGAVNRSLGVIDQRPGPQVEPIVIPAEVIGQALLTARELCDMFDGVGKQRFRNWTVRGRIEAVTVDLLGRPLYAVSDVQRLLCTCRPPRVPCAVQHARVGATLA